MGFRLSGGRPKNRNQSTYWVQAARAQNRARTTTQAVAQAFNSRYARITENLLSTYVATYGSLDYPPGASPTLIKAVQRYNALKIQIDGDVASATNADLSKLATAAKNVLVEIAKREGTSVQWNARSKVLAFGDCMMDFS